MNKSYSRVAATILLCLLTAGLVFQSCCKEDEGFRINAFGPYDAERGSEVSFWGSGLDQVGSIVFPNGDVFERGQFRLEGGRIAVTIPADYPLCSEGLVIVNGTDGSMLWQSRLFRVLSQVSVTGVTPSSEKEPLLEGQDVTITGRVLKSVAAVIFNSGSPAEYRLPVSTNNDNELTFKLPKEAGSGIFVLRVEPRCEEDDSTFTEGLMIFALEPFIIDVLPNIEPVPACDFNIKVTGGNFNRIDWYIDEEGDTVSDVLLGTTVAKATYVSNTELTIAIPKNAPSAPTQLTVTVFSNGTKITSTQTFSVIKPVIECGKRSGTLRYIITGTNLCAVSSTAGSLVFIGLNNSGSEIILGSAPAAGDGNITPTQVTWVYSNASVLNAYVKIRVRLANGDWIEWNRIDCE